MDAPTISIVLVHSSPRLAALADSLASGYPDLEVIARAASLDAIPAAQLLHAIVLTDEAPSGSESIIDRIRSIRALGARVIVLADDDFPAGVVPAMAAGADAVLPPTSSSRRVAEQVRLVANRARLIGRA